MTRASDAHNRTMNDTVTETPSDPSDDPPSAYVLLGGDAGVRALVDRFYDLMEMDERFGALRAMHPASLDSARDKLFWFLCGWTGGPSYYMERIGHPMLRARHLPFPIGTAERDQWLTCMAQAMADLSIDGEFFDRLLQSFGNTADWMRNRPG